MYPSQHFPFGADFVRQAGNYWPLIRTYQVCPNRKLAGDWELVLTLCTTEESLLLSGIEQRLSGHAAVSVFTIQTELCLISNTTVLQYVLKFNLLATDFFSNFSTPCI